MIKTERLELVGFDSKYAADLFELWSDYDVIKYTLTPLASNLNECKKIIDTQKSRTNQSFRDRFVITLNGKAIGIAGCICMNQEESEFGLYYQLSRLYWGYGYASEAVKAIIEHVSRHYPRAIIKANAVSVNASSITLLKKMGLKQTHIEEKGFKRNNLELDLVHFSSLYRQKS